MKRITVSSDPLDNGCRVWFNCFVHDTAAELQRAAKKFSVFKDIDWSDTQGCFHPNLSFTINKNGYREKAGPYIGTMRLNREKLLAHIIIHECTHAAINYVNVLKCQSGYMIGNSNIATEEALCYAVHEFSDVLLKHFRILR